MTFLTPISIGCISAALTALISAALAPLFADIRRGRVFRRIMAEPLLAPGAALSRVELQGHPAPILGPCRVESVERGRVVLRETATGDLLPITGVELELLWPVVARSRGRKGAGA